MLGVNALVKRGVPLSTAQAIVQGWINAQIVSYMRPNPRRYATTLKSATSKYTPAGPFRNVPTTNA